MRWMLLSLLMQLAAASVAQAQCYLDPVTGQQVCAPRPATIPGDLAPADDSRPGVLWVAVDESAHCRISVGAGSAGSGTLIEVDESTGLVLTCAHLFDQATGRIVVAFRNGQRFAARLIARDRAHDLAALAIRRPEVSAIVVSRQDPSGPLSACGFGSDGRFRCVRGLLMGQAVAAGARYPSLTISGAVRPGDSGGGVLNARGELVGVVWGERDGLTYATCGRPLREFLDGVRRRNVANSPQRDWQAWSNHIEAQVRALDEKKQDKGQYVRAEELQAYMRVADALKLDVEQFARRSEVDGNITSLAARLEAINQRVQQVAASGGGLSRGLSWGKLVAGALGLSGPVAAAVLVAAGLAARRATRSNRGAERVSTPVAVDSPPPPQRTMPETHFVPVEQDSFAKAHQWASEHVARKYPGATEILQSQDSLIKQYLSAH